jgi:hypothetical protein
MPRARRAPRSRRTGRARPRGRDGHDEAACATSRNEFRLFVLLGSSSPALCVALVQCRRCPGPPPIHALESVCPATTCRCCSRGVSYLRSQPCGSRRRSMHDRANGLLRIPFRDCMKTPDRGRSGTLPSAENGLRGLYFGVWCYRRPTIGDSPTTFHTVSPRTLVNRIVLWSWALKRTDAFAPVHSR